MYIQTLPNQVLQNARKTNEKLHKPSNLTIENDEIFHIPKVFQFFLKSVRRTFCSLQTQCGTLIFVRSLNVVISNEKRENIQFRFLEMTKLSIFHRFYKAPPASASSAASPAPPSQRTQPSQRSPASRLKQPSEPSYLTKCETGFVSHFASDVHILFAWRLLRLHRTKGTSSSSSSRSCTSSVCAYVHVHE